LSPFPVGGLEGDPVPLPFDVEVRQAAAIHVESGIDPTFSLAGENDPLQGQPRVGLARVDSPAVDQVTLLVFDEPFGQSQPRNGLGGARAASAGRRLAAAAAGSATISGRRSGRRERSGAGELVERLRAR
jgi:hypothetical protein